MRLTPGQAWAKSVLFLKTERNSGYEWNFPGLAARRETTLSHIHHCSFLIPRFLEANIYVTKYHQKSFFFFPFYNFTSISDSHTFLVFSFLLVCFVFLLDPGIRRHLAANCETRSQWTSSAGPTSGRPRSRRQRTRSVGPVQPQRTSAELRLTERSTRLTVVWSLSPTARSERRQWWWWRFRR